MASLKIINVVDECRKDEILQCHNTSGVGLMRGEDYYLVEISFLCEYLTFVFLF